MKFKQNEYKHKKKIINQSQSRGVIVCKSYSYFSWLDLHFTLRNSSYKLCSSTMDHQIPQYTLQRRCFPSLLPLYLFHLVNHNRQGQSNQLPCKKDKLSIPFLPFQMCYYPQIFNIKLILFSFLFMNLLLFFLSKNEAKLRVLNY